MMQSERPCAQVGIEVEVVRAEPGGAVIRSYRLPAGSRIDQLLQLAAADPAFAGVVIDPAAIGIHGRLAPVGQVLEDGDRLELYRPLAADPKQARRARARSGPLRR